jgi:peroxiredoxin
MTVLKSWVVTILAALALIFSPVAMALDVGPPVGEQIPAFEARDAQGKPVQWTDIAGSKGTVLVFFRSARWCPYCQAQLIALKDAAVPLSQRGYQLVAVSYDEPEVLANFIKLRAIPYTLLSDKNSAMIDAFKLRDPQYKSDSFAYGVPLPSIFVISPAGMVQAKLAEEGYKTRPPVETVIAAVDAVLARQH